MATTQAPALPGARAVSSSGETVQQTSVDEYQQSPATVRFRRFTVYGNVGYLRGQEAGFTMAEARGLQQRGMGDIVHTRDASTAMVTK